MAPKESSQDILDLTDGVSTNQLHLTSWNLHDYEGNDCPCLLTWDVEGAPNTFRMGHRRWTEMSKHILEADNVCQPQQVDGQFNATRAENQKTSKHMNANTTTIQEIPD